METVINEIKISQSLKKDLELFYANTDLSRQQRNILNTILQKYYSEGYQNGKINIIMQGHK